MATESSLPDAAPEADAAANPAAGFGIFELEGAKHVTLYNLAVEASRSDGVTCTDCRCVISSSFYR